jgi:hypothetical protein
MGVSNNLKIVYKMHYYCMAKSRDWSTRKGRLIENERITQASHLGNPPED